MSDSRHPKFHRRWLRFSLRTMLLFVVLLSLALAWFRTQSDDPEVVALAEKYGRVVEFKKGIGKVILLDQNGVETVLPRLYRLRHLEVLVVVNTELADEDLRHVGALEHLTKLDLSNCDLAGDDLQHLAGLTKLKELRLARNPVTDEGLRHLASMHKLERLDLFSTDIRGPGFAHLENLSALEFLYLTNSTLDDSGMPHIAELHKLRRFDFGSTNVTEAGLMELVQLHYLITIGPPDSMPVDAMLRFREAHIQARRRARAAGKTVPPDHIAPFGSVVARHGELD